VSNHPARRPPRRPLSRRQFLIRSGVLGAAGLTLPSFLAACGGDDDSGSSGTGGGGTGGGGGGGGNGQLYFENWPEYIDLTEDGATGTVDRFIEATGVDMKYTEAYNDNNEYFAKIQPLLGTGKTIDPDILAPTGWMAGRLINLGWVDKLPIDQVPNAANLRADLKGAAWDPTGEYTLPWQTGITGIAYNLDATGRELGSVDDLFDPEFNGRIGMLLEMRDTIGLILLSMGIDPSTLITYDDAAAAFDKLAAATNDGQIRQFTGNDYIDDLSLGNFAACVAWSGDVAQLTLDNPSVKFIIPESGAMSWADCMVLPKGSGDHDLAAKWMDFVYDPVQAAQITAYVQYISPVEGVKEELAKIDPTLAENPLVVPDSEMLAQLSTFATLSEDVEAEYDAAFSDITGA
jgi:spermidine/putrescine transport system substrate-binding protein